MRRCLSLWFCLLCLCGMLGSRPAGAATFTVRTLLDTDGTTCGVADCTLRQAIKAANGDGAASTIVFASNLSGTIALGSQLPAITQTLSINALGGGRIVLDAGGSNYRIFTSSTAGANLTVRGLTLQNGVGIVNGGGAILSFANNVLTVLNCTFKNNRANAYGGALYQRFGTLRVVNCTFEDNSAAGDNTGGRWM